MLWSIGAVSLWVLDCQSKSQCEHWRKLASFLLPSVLCREVHAFPAMRGEKKSNYLVQSLLWLAFFIQKNASALGQTTQYSLISFSQDHILCGYTKWYCSTFFSLWHSISQVSLLMPKLNMFVLLLKFKSVIRIVEKMDLFSWKYS